MRTTLWIWQFRVMAGLRCAKEVIDENIHSDMELVGTLKFAHDIYEGSVLGRLNKTHV